LEPKKEYLSELLRSAGSVAEEAEVFLLSSRSMPIQFEANELKQVQSKESTSVALRIFREGRIGFATASGEDGLENLVDMAVETSQFGGPANFQFPSSQDYSEVRIFDSEVEEMNMETMVEIGKELIAKVRGTYS
jgi:PmbA protein